MIATTSSREEAYDAVLKYQVINEVLKLPDVTVARARREPITKA